MEPNNETVDNSADTMTLPDGTIVNLHYHPDRKYVPVKNIADEDEQQEDPD